MKTMPSFNQVEWYWNRLRCMSVSEIMDRAGKQASHAMARRREPVSVPQARFERSGARWLPREIPESAGQAVASMEQAVGRVGVGVARANEA